THRALGLVRRLGAGVALAAGGQRGDEGGRGDGDDLRGLSHVDSCVLFRVRSRDAPGGKAGTHAPRAGRAGVGRSVASLVPLSLQQATARLPTGSVRVHTLAAPPL